MKPQEFLERARTFCIAVVGDLIIDRYILGEVDRISPEAPVPVVRQTGTIQSKGGAGNVSENLRCMGVKVESFYGSYTPVKTRVMSGNHHLLRIDEELEPEWMVWEEIPPSFRYLLATKSVDVLVISDYGK